MNIVTTMENLSPVKRGFLRNNFNFLKLTLEQAKTLDDGDPRF